MGQLYTAITVQNNEVKIYNLIQQGCQNNISDFISRKLMEHSWWENDFLGAMIAKLLHNPMVVAWVGEYCELARNYEELSERWKKIDPCSLFELQGKINKNDEEQHIESGNLTLDGKFLVNHTKKMYIDGTKYKKKFNEDKDWIPHPLPLLTAIGNGLGGGDYMGKKGQEYIGSWALDTISVEDTAPLDYELLDVFFLDD